MSSIQHPEQSALLRLLDGELRPREARHVERHMESCWECRAELEELKKTVADCMRYRNEFVAQAMPEPPQTWGDIYAGFARIDRDTPQRSGLLQILRGTGSLRWAVGALTAALAVAGALYLGGVVSSTKHPAPVSVQHQEPQLLLTSAGSGAAPSEVPPRPAVPSRPAAIAPGPTASISNELSVLQALHGIGADLGDPLRVTLSNGRVLVAGVGVAPARQRQIRTALDSLPLVSLEFSDPAPPNAPAETAPSAAPAPAETAPAFQSKLEAEFGGRAALDRFAAEALTWNDTLTSHAYALRSLAQQFPSDAPLSDADRASLHTLVADHVAAMAIPAGNYEHALVPVLTALGASAAVSPASSATTWQTCSEHLFQAARSVEMLSSRLLGVARGDKVKQDIPAELLGAVSDLRADLEQDRRLLGR